MKRIVCQMAVFCVVFCTLIPFAGAQENGEKEVEGKLLNTMNMIRRFYVEKVDLGEITDKGIVEMLKELDPHSVFIPAKEVEKSNEPLQGNFDGVGVAFQILKDTINIVEVIAGGPSEKLGLLPGDKILKINGNIAYGDTITPTYVYNNLRGKKGTVVEIDIKRRGKADLIHFKIVRDKIPIHSIETYFMIDKSIGYVHLDRFSRTSADEFKTALSELKNDGMKDLVLDLRGNGGGFLDIAIELVNQFLEKDKLIVYTEGVSSPKQEVFSTGTGEFKNGRLIVLIDEGSASASEILSGAIQDWDRGVVVGRRSFGKGLVQRIFPLPDKSEIRLTTSRYYTPSGRCIQKPYNDGLENYYGDYMKRLEHKELVSPDSIHFPDSLKYFTQNKRVVYGGGGIMPDIFIPIDTVRASDYFIDLRSKGLHTNFTLDWSNQNRDRMLKEFPTFNEFDKNFDYKALFLEFKEYAAKEGIKEKNIKKDWVTSWVNNYLNTSRKDSNGYESYINYAQKLLTDTSFYNDIYKKAKEEDQRSEAIVKKSDEYIDQLIKAMVARNLYGTKYYYVVMSKLDEGYLQAIEIIKNEKLYKSIIKK